MNNKRTVLVCDSDYRFLNAIEKDLANEDFDVDTIDNAADLVPSAIRLQPGIILVNPDMKGFNEQDVCRHIILEQRVHVMLLVDSNSARPARLGNCSVDVVTKPVEAGTLVHLLEQHIAADQ